MGSDKAVARPATSDGVTDAWEPGWKDGLNRSNRRDGLFAAGRMRIIQ